MFYNCRILVIESSDSVNQTAEYYGGSALVGAQLPINAQLSKLGDRCDGNCVRNLVSDWLEVTPSGGTANWAVSLWKRVPSAFNKGLYPQSDESLAIVDIDASKGFVYLWVHLSFAIFAIFDLIRQLKLLEMACDQIQTCLIFPLRWACFPIKIC